ncbi:FAR-17a/AIG1-like protein [Cerioporus squamosus]|nr:FAR-17a/AIG1-like protein [Cerioporus squamosus]
MSVKSLPFLLHTTAAAVMAYGYIHLPDVVANMPMANMKGGHFQFLTIQGLCIAWITMVLSVGCDIIPSSRFLKSAKRAFLMSALPLAIVISVIYWTLLLLLPHLILMPDPNASEPTSASAMPEPQRLPLSTDLALHAAPAVSLIIDFYFLERKYPKSVSRYGSFVLAAVVGTWYACWVEYCASYNGFFPYPFLTQSPFNVRVVIYSGASLFAAVAFIAINALHP